MTSNEIRRRFLAFFEKRGHAVIPSSSLVPENDPSVLFTTAGMQPLVPYLLGEPHPKGKRLVNVQKCVRTQDIDEVGDNTHDTFFEMLGNWSLGDYFKEDAIGWSYEFLTSKEEGLGLDPARLYITCFEGDENAPRDEESARIWKSLNVPEGRIYFLGAKDNWWGPGDSGPCGPDTEMFYDITEEGMGELTKEEFIRASEEQKLVEVWNDVFMEYEKKNGSVIGKLKNKNVDTGAGLERLAMVMQGKDSIFETDLFEKPMKAINESSSIDNVRAKRIIADHIRTAVFMIGDGVVPTNTDRGYVLRRIVRRAVRYANALKISVTISAFVDDVISIYSETYKNLRDNQATITSTIAEEEVKFRATLIRGMKHFKDIAHGEISGRDAFILFSTYGFPVEMTAELAGEQGLEVDIDEFEKELGKHQELSRAGAEQKFKGGLADDSPETTMLHTATHLMLAGLRKYLGDHVHQAGSNITKERSRFDFTYPEKVGRDVLDNVEAYVNEAIAKRADVTITPMPKEEAQKAGVEGSFWEKYPDTVNVYMIKAPDGTVYSQELCGGPHVKNTGDIRGTFKIVKEEASSAGVRRVKAILEK